MIVRSLIHFELMLVQGDIELVSVDLVRFVFGSTGV
jgi:hypothetical protein